MRSTRLSALAAMGVAALAYAAGPVLASPAGRGHRHAKPVRQHKHLREKARRVRQIAAGSLKEANGFVRAAG